ncbi:MAG: DUF167 domain-containing protein [Patescibacteria group bacterium]
MRYTVRVTAHAKHEAVTKIDPQTLHVRVAVPPEKGRANAAVIVALAQHLGVASSRITIVRGHASRQKIVDICDEKTD